MSLEIVYAANPMCSWCWGFAPVMREVASRAAGRARITLTTGALGRGDRPMRAEDREAVAEHWRHVTELTGQPFDFSFFEREPFTYDTEPSCRAVAILRQHYPALALAGFERLQERFYAEGGDPTDTAFLRETLGQFGIDGELFDAEFHSPALAAFVAREWQDVAALGITGYPTLIGLGRASPAVLAVGCEPEDTVIGRLAAWLHPEGWGAAG